VRADQALRRLGSVFSFLCSMCLLGMLVITASTIILRPFDISFYWMFPWSMVLFVWLSFFGFFAAMIFGRDIRIDFVAKLFGDAGHTATRIIGQFVMLWVLFVLLREMPGVLISQTGGVDGASMPWGGEVPRRALTVPLALSCIGIAAALVVDILKLWCRLPEHFGGDMPGA
jgi:TRAP-type C4-dicarboxylate transport system permease small subunit